MDAKHHGTPSIAELVNMTTMPNFRTVIDALLVIVALALFVAEARARLQMFRNEQRERISHTDLDRDTCVSTRAVRASAPARIFNPSRREPRESGVEWAYGTPPSILRSWPQAPLYVDVPPYAGCEWSWRDDVGEDCGGANEDENMRFQSSFDKYVVNNASLATRYTDGASDSSSATLGTRTERGVPFNSEVPIAFETSLFVGTCVLRFRGLPAPPWMSAERRDRIEATLNKYFKGKKRRFQVVVQGRFKRECPAHVLVSGHEFFKPLANVPGKSIIRAITRAMKTLSVTLRLNNLLGARPHAYSSLIASAQTLRVDKRGDEPDILEPIEEHTTRLGGIFAAPHRRRLFARKSAANFKLDPDAYADANKPVASCSVSPRKRRKLFANANAAARYVFRPDDVITMDFYQHVFDAESYTLKFGTPSLLTVDLANHLAHQPAQIMARAVHSGEYLWCFALWHERLLAAPPPPPPPPTMSPRAHSRHDACM
jgi:hypothetical protein